MASDPEPMSPYPAEVGIIGQVVCGIVSVGGFTGGVFGVFTTDNEIGTAGLLLIGGFAGLTALLGRVPRLKAGGVDLDASSYRRGAVAGADAVAEVTAEAALADKPADEVAEAARMSAIAINDWFTSSLGNAAGPPRLAVRADHMADGRVLFYDVDGNLIAARESKNHPIRRNTPSGVDSTPEDVAK